MARRGKLPPKKVNASKTNRKARKFPSKQHTADDRSEPARVLVVAAHEPRPDSNARNLEDPHLSFRKSIQAAVEEIDRLLCNVDPRAGISGAGAVR